MPFSPSSFSATSRTAIASGWSPGCPGATGAAPTRACGAGAAVAGLTAASVKQ